MIDGYEVAVCIPQYAAVACVLPPVKIYCIIDCFHRRGVFFISCVMIWIEKSFLFKCKGFGRWGGLFQKRPRALKISMFKNICFNVLVCYCIWKLKITIWNSTNYSTRTLEVLRPNEAIHLLSYWVLCVIDYVSKFVWLVELVELK